MQELLRNGKSLMLSAARRAGVFDAVRDSRWRHERLLILAYHGVSLDDEHEWNPGLYMSPAKFQSRLEALDRGGYTILPLADAIAALREGGLPPRSVSLTFDDGNYDFFHRVFPALKARRYPATVYLTTYYCEYNRPIFNLVCSYMLWKARGRGAVTLRSVTGDDRSFALGNAADREACVRGLIAFAERQQLSAGEKDTMASRLASLIGIDYEGLKARRILHLMNTEEVAQLATEAVDFQLHTHRHRCPHDAESFSREIRDNRTRIERLTRHSARHFCYPSGRYQTFFLPWLEQENVASATTCDPGLATPKSSPLLLPRFVDTHNVSATKFEGWLSGAAAWLPAGRRSYADAG